MPREPPLEVVRVVRSRALDEAAAAVTDAERRADLAREALSSARDDERALRTSAAEQRRREASVLAASLSPRALAQLAAFERGLETRLASAVARTAEAERRATDAEVHERARRDELIAAKGGLDVVERHQARVREIHERREQDALDESAEQSHVARRQPRR